METARSVRDAFDLTGRVALVTGAGGGIGRTTAEVLAGAGATVVCADIDAATAHETASGILGDGGKAESAELDVSARGAAEALVGHITARHGALHVMCNIAGIMIDSTIIDLDPDEFDRILSVNLKGVLYGCQAAGKAMVAQRGGSIINMASAAVLAPSPGIGPYAICKAGVAQLTMSMAVEVGKHGVRVNTMAPGFVPTNMTARVLHGPRRERERGDQGGSDQAHGSLRPAATRRRDVGHRVRRAVSRLGRQQLRHGAAAQPQRRRLHVVLTRSPRRRRGRTLGEAHQVKLAGRRVRHDDGGPGPDERDGGADGHRIGHGAVRIDAGDARGWRRTGARSTAGSLEDERTRRRVDHGARDRAAVGPDLGQGGGAVGRELGVEALAGRLADPHRAPSATTSTYCTPPPRPLGASANAGPDDVAPLGRKTVRCRSVAS